MNNRDEEIREVVRQYRKRLRVMSLSQLEAEWERVMNWLKPDRIKNEGVKNSEADL